ncbi:MAG: acyl-CoA dehydrogenase family protein [Elainellaceae cyanobacterium]
MDSAAQLLAQATSYLHESVAPYATDIDHHPQALLNALKGLGDRSLLGLKTPAGWHGSDVDAKTFYEFQELVSRHSGALAFLQTQHQSAVAKLAQSANEPLKQAYLPRASQGQPLLGVGFSQLRRSGTPPVRAVPVESGYQISGEVPWVTGFGMFQAFILGAILPDGRALFGIVPFQDATQDDGGEIAFSKPMPLAAMESTNTVKARLTNWVLPESQVVFIKPTDWIQKSDRQGILNHSFFALGCARAGLDVVERAYQLSSSEFIQSAWEALNRELLHCRDAIYQAHCGGYLAAPYDQEKATLEGDRLRLRGWSVDMAGRCAHAAVIVSRGAANYRHHPAQRIYREALAFSVFGQTTEIMEASLNHLIRE